MNYCFHVFIPLLVGSEIVKVVLIQVGKCGVVIGHTVSGNVTPVSRDLQKKVILSSAFDYLLDVRLIG